MASPNGSWTVAGGKKNKAQNSRMMSKGKKKAVVENMPRIEPNRKFTGLLADKPTRRQATTSTVHFAD